MCLFFVELDQRPELLCAECIAQIQKELDPAVARCTDGHSEYKGAQSNTARSPWNPNGAICEECRGVVEETIGSGALARRHFVIQRFAKPSLSLTALDMQHHVLQIFARDSLRLARELPGLKVSQASLSRKLHNSKPAAFLALT